MTNTVTFDDEWLDQLTLATGVHGSPSEGMCWMEAIAFTQGEDFTDHPDCVSPAIAAFARSWQDALDDEGRQRLIKPLFWDVVGTRTGDPKVESELAWMAIDWLGRVHTPAWFRHAGLTEQAEALAGMEKLSTATVPSAVSCLVDAREAARLVSQEAKRAAIKEEAVGEPAAKIAAWEALRPIAVHAAESAVGEAVREAAGEAAGEPARSLGWPGSAAQTKAWDAVRGTVWEAAGEAAWVTVGEASWNAARDAAGEVACFADRDAARGAARKAARDALVPVKVELRTSAAALIERMCDHARSARG